MRVSTDDSVSPSSTRGPREIEPNRQSEREEGEKKTAGWVGRIGESGTKRETWEREGRIAMEIIIRLCPNGTVPSTRLANVVNHPLHPRVQDSQKAWAVEQVIEEI